MSFQLDRTGSLNLLGESSPLAPFLARFEYRPEQQQMLGEVVDIFNKEGLALIEAGTGVGKSLAYLIPALLWAHKTGERVVISTHTIALQEQLISKDLPDLIGALDIDLDCTLVKGMRHYLCLSRLQGALEHHAAFSSMGARLRAIEANGNGSSSDLRQIPAIRCESEHCNGGRCTFYRNCHFFKARRKAEESEVLIVNHHILLLDYLRRLNDPNSNILPPYSRLIIDEAHHLDKVATEVFAKRLSLSELSRELDSLADQDVSASLIAAARDIQIKLALFSDPMPDKVPLKEAPLPQKEHIQELVQSLTALNTDILSHCEKIKEPLKTELLGYARKYSEMGELAHTLLMEESIDGTVRWAEPTRSALPTYCEASVDTSHQLRPFLQEAKSTLLSSATLTNSGSFTYLLDRLGFEKNEPAITSSYPSPFDFKNQAALFIPTDFPLPDSPHFTEAAANLIEKAVHASDGGAFVLCTSYRQLDALFDALEERLEKYELLKQRDESRTRLLEKFRKARRPVLFATSSFWEGVDVAGKMRAVIIVKLPFQVPSDPLTVARFKHLESLGKNPFMHYTLPEAVLRFTQGFGRLIRSKEDRGICLCLDVRLHTKTYGSKFLKGITAPSTFGTTAEIEKSMEGFWSVTESNR